MLSDAWPTVFDVSDPTRGGGLLPRAQSKEVRTVSVAVRVPATLAKEFERVAVAKERTVSAC
jgi:hypothetical protein